MSALGPDVCTRCMTTHPLNEQGERPCPKPPVERSESDGWIPAIIWRCSGATKGYRGGKGTNIPDMSKVFPNPGHREPRLSDLGLSEADGAALGI